MFRAVDLFLIDKTDQLMTWAQKHHGVNLALLKLVLWVFVGISSLLSAVLQNSPFMAALSVMVWGYLIYHEYKEWRENYDYYENYRKAMKLSAVAVAMRDMAIFLRCSTLGFSGFVVGTTVANLFLRKYDFGYFISDLSWFAIVFQYYIATSRYLGPGDFATKKQEAFSKDMVGNEF